MRQQTLTWLSVLLALAMTLSACGTAAPDAATVPESEAGASSEEQLSEPFLSSGHLPSTP